MRKAHRRRALIALCLAAAAGAWSFRRVLLPARALVLPREAATLRDLASRSRDVVELRQRLAALGIGAIRTEAPCLPPPAWTPASSDNYLELWRRCARPGRDAREVRLSRRPGVARVIGLDEPPGLVELTRPGDALLAAGRVREAKAAWQAALDAAPGLAGLWTRLAEADRRLGDPAAAERALGRAMRCAGDNAEIHDRLGDLFAATKRPGMAANAFEIAAGLDEGSAPRWLKAARALDRAGQRARAAACARRALDRDPGNGEAAALADRPGDRPR
ncbi:MAG: tetratricopeptide repeat protein [Candidatus Coatesbacteria bacterium]